VTPHRIHLRGHWDATPLGDGRTRHVRRFGRPRTLEPGVTVWVTGSLSPGPVTVAINGTPLGTAEGSFAFDVTSFLMPRSELVIESAGGAPEEVVLEIRSPDR
jgi:hypothetical protein